MKLLETYNKENHSYSVKITGYLFKRADKKKFGRKTFQTELHATQNQGGLNACQALLDEHKRNPYTTIDEIIADIQNIAVESHNQNRKLLKLFDLKPAKVEMILNDKRISRE